MTSLLFFNPRFRQQQTPRNKKAHYYVWFLGAKEATGLKGPEVTIPPMRQLLRESHHQAPNKMTLQVSEKGVKIVQVVPSINKSGKIKMELVKFLVPYYSICDVSLGPAPYNDVVAVVMLIFNPETRCPVHVHCYRCDSPDTAKRLFTGIHLLVARPENQKRFTELEYRLVVRGLLPDRTSEQRRPRNPPTPSSHQLINSTQQQEHEAARDTRQSSLISEEFEFLNHEGSSSGGEDEWPSTTPQHRNSKPPLLSSAAGASFFEREEAKRVAQMHQAVFQELKEKLTDNKGKCPLLLPPKDYSATLRRASELTTASSDQSSQNSKQLKAAESKESGKVRGKPPRYPVETHWSSSSTSGLGSDVSPNADKTHTSPISHYFRQSDPRSTNISNLHLERSSHRSEENISERFRGPSSTFYEDFNQIVCSHVASDIISPLPPPAAIYPAKQRHSVAVTAFDHRDAFETSTPLVSKANKYEVPKQRNNAIKKHSSFATKFPQSKTRNIGIPLSSNHTDDSPDGIMRRFGDTIRFQAKVFNQNSKDRPNQHSHGDPPPYRKGRGANNHSNWITRKPNRSREVAPTSPVNGGLASRPKFLSVENLTAQRSMEYTMDRLSPYGREGYHEHYALKSNGRHAMNGERRPNSLWHLPDFVDPFGKRYEKMPNFSANHRVWHLPPYNGGHGHHVVPTPPQSPPAPPRDLRRRSWYVPFYERDRM